MRKSLQVSRKNHFVPEGLMRPWLWPDNQLRAYWWDHRRFQLVSKVRGVGSFCFQMDLLTTRSRLGHSDQLEQYFAQIDSKGISARDALIKDGPNRLTEEQRCDFARLLMSLVVRQSENVRKSKGAAQLVRQELDSDAALIDALRQQNVSLSPSRLMEIEAEAPFDDQAFVGVMQKIADDDRVGHNLINANWETVDVDKDDGSLVLGDKPFIRHGNIRKGKEAWLCALPLSPGCLFVASNRDDVMTKTLKLSRRRLVKYVNSEGASRADRFVFVADEAHANWLRKKLASGARGEAT